MGLVWREVHILTRRVYSPSKGSFFFHYCYTLDNYSLYMSFKHAPVLFIFSPLQVKNKPHDRVQSIVFILGSGKLNRTGSVYTVNSTQQCISESETMKGKRFTGWKVLHSKHHPQEQNPQNCTEVRHTRVIFFTVRTSVLGRTAALVARGVRQQPSAGKIKIKCPLI
jgi:hypothetical protein